MCHQYPKQAVILSKDKLFIISLGVTKDVFFSPIRYCALTVHISLPNTFDQ